MYEKLIKSIALLYKNGKIKMNLVINTENKDKFDVRVFVNPAMESVRNLIRNKLDNVFHSSGHAND